MQSVRISQEVVEDARWLPGFLRAAARKVNEDGWPLVTAGMLDVAFHSHSEELYEWLGEHPDLASKTDCRRRGRIVYNRLTYTYEVQRILCIERWPALDRYERVLFYF